MVSPTPRSGRSRPLPVAALLLCLPIAGCGGDAGDGPDPSPRNVTIAVKRETGNRAIASAAGVIRRPVALAIRVSAAPRQRVVVTWGLSCPKSDGLEDAVKGTGGRYSTTPPNVRALRLPRRQIALCAVRGDVRLTRKGRVKITLLGSGR